MRAAATVPAAIGLAALVAGLAVAPAGAASGTPDFELFKARVEPVLQSVCAQCHAGKGKGKLGLIVHAPGSPFPDAEHRKNYETVLKLVVPGDPDRSPFLQKPLANSKDGVKHDGGDRIFPGTPAYRAFVDFIEGVALDPSSMAAASGAPASRAPEPDSVATIGDHGLTIEAESMSASGGVLQTMGPDGRSGVMEPNSKGGRLVGRFRVNRSGTYAVTARAAGAGRALSLSFDGGDPMAVEVGGARGSASSDVLCDACPKVICDGGRPLDARRGTLALADDPTTGTAGAGGLRMEGAPARVLLPKDVGHTRVEATVADVREGTEARLLFDVLDAENGKYVALEPGGDVVIGVVEAGRSRAVARAPRPKATPGTRLRVDFVSGVAVARVDGKPVVHANFDRALGAGRFGFEVAGSLVLRELVVHARQEEVHRMRLSVAGVVTLARGDHRVEVALPPGGASLDSISLKEIVP